MLVTVIQSRTKAYVYSRVGQHGSEKEVVFSSGASLKRIRETHIDNIRVAMAGYSGQTLEKVVPAYMK